MNGQYSLNREAIRQALTILATTAGAWLAVAYESRSETFLIATFGLILLAVPPLQRYSRRLLLAGGAVLLWSCVSFGPAFLVQASFRESLLAHGISLGSTMSPQFWLTLEDVTLLAAGLLWSLNCLGGTLSLQKRWMLLMCMSVFLVPVGIGVLFPSNELHGFTVGQFVNRSETGDILIMGGLASFASGCNAWSRRRGHGVWWFVLSFFFSLALARNQSRAAFVIYFIGLIVYLCLLPSFRRSPKMILSSIVAGCFFVVYSLGIEGGGIEKRFQEFFAGGELRQGIFCDAVSLIGKNPLFGVGLGNFEGVFNTQRIDTSHTPFRMVIVESDWLGVGAELGIPGMALFALLLAILYLDYFRNVSATPLTPFSLAIGIAFLIHSFVDVGAHQMGTCWACLFLIGLGAVRTQRPTDISIPQLAWRFFGLSLLILAGLRLQSDSPNPWMPTRVSSDLIEDRIIKHPTRLVEEKVLLDRDISWFPLNWLLYYQRGLVTLQIPELAKESIKDFRIAIFLEENTPDLPDSINSACKSIGTPEAEAIRTEIIPATITRDSGLFRKMYDPALDRQDDKGLSILAKGDAELQLLAVLGQPPDQFDSWREKYLQAHSSFQGLPLYLVKELFGRWCDSDSAPTLVKEWGEHPTWNAPGWTSYVRALAKLGRFSDAVSTALSELGTKKIPVLSRDSSLEEAKSYFESSHDIFYGVQYYLSLIQTKDEVRAQAVLEELSKDPRCPDYILCVLGAKWHKEGKDEQAWKILAPLVDQA